MKKTLIILAMFVLPLGGCSKKIPESSFPPKNIQHQEYIWLYQDGNIVKYFPNTPESSVNFPIPADLKPVDFTFGKTFQVSADNQFVVWFTPVKGLIKWSSQDKQISAFYQPTEWFYENPYFQFFGDTHQLILVDKKGTEIITINIENNQIETQPIPYPFGSVFRISPDTKKFLYIEGYRQSSVNPEYLITTIDGKELSRIRTNAEVSDRSQVGWSSDSSQIITIEDSGAIVTYAIDSPHEKSILYTLPENERVEDMIQNDNYLFVSGRSYWYLFDTASKKILHRLPLEALNQLNRPTYIYSKASDYFYIEESVKSFDTSYKRLWKSDWIGTKQIVIPKYGITTASVNVY